MTSRRTTSRSMSLPNAYLYGVGRAVKFVGRNLGTALMTALSFAIIYKYVLNGSRAQHTTPAVPEE